jgi:FtsH-binding integral membrane protein
VVPLRYSPGNIITVLMVALVACLFVARFRIRPDSNWPLVLYIGLFAYHQYFDGRLHPNILYAAVVSALLIRFEFVGGKSMFLFRAAELLSLSMLLQELYQTVIF